MPRASAALILVLLVLQAPANAAVSAQDLYVEGKYAEAMAAGEAEGGTNGYTFAARASLADSDLRDVPCIACLSRAEELARMAIAADPENAEAYVLLVTALGRKARLIGFFHAQQEAIAGQTDAAIGKALVLTTGSAFAHAARGAWHIEVVNQARCFLARALYGARVELGKCYFLEAIALEPENLFIRYQYALDLEAYDFAAERAAIESALAAAAMVMPRNAYEVSIKARAEILCGLLQAGMIEAFHQRMRAIRGDGPA